LAAVGQNGGVYTSSDYGINWTDHTNSNSQGWDSITSSGSGQYLAAGSLYGDIWTSNNYGATWTDRQTGAGSQDWYSIASSNNGQYLAAVESAWTGNVYTSNDYGATWTDQTNAGSRVWTSVTSSSSGQYLAAAAAYGSNIYTSDDYGATWVTQTGAPSQTWQSVTSSSNGQYLAASSYGDIYTSSDYGVTWTDQTVPGSHTWYSIASSSTGQYLAAVAWGIGVWTADDPSLAPPTTSTTITSTIGSTITLTSNGTVNLNAIPTGNGVQTIASDTVSVSTNDGSGYTLQLNETNGSTTLTSGSNTIPATTGTKSSPVAETAESWGYRVDSIGGFGSGPTTSLSNQPIGSLTFAAVPASTSPDTIKTTATTANNDTTNVWYGIAVDTSVPSGTYTNSVTYTAVAN
jgi:hypothetical protein